MAYVWTLKTVSASPEPLTPPPRWSCDLKLTTNNNWSKSKNNSAPSFWLFSLTWNCPSSGAQPNHCRALTSATARTEPIDSGWTSSKTRQSLLVGRVVYTAGLPALFDPGCTDQMAIWRLYAVTTVVDSQRPQRTFDGSCCTCPTWLARFNHHKTGSAHTSCVL